MVAEPGFWTWTVGDLATWAGAAASFAAVYTALRLSGRDSRARRQEAEDLEHVFAPAVAEEILQIRWVCDQIARIGGRDAPIETRYRGMYEHLASLRGPTLDLVAARDVYRGERGRRLMSLYAALLRQAADIPNLPKPSSNEGLLFAIADIAGTAGDLQRLAEESLALIWKVTPQPDVPIPASHEPPGYRARVER